MPHPDTFLAFLLVPVVPPVDPISFGIDVLTTLIGALFGGIFGGSDTGSLNKAVDDLRSTLATGLDKLKRFSWSIAFALGTLLQTLHAIWVNFLDALWTLLKRIMTALKKFLTETLPKLINLLRKLHDRLAYIYQHYIRPLLNYIQIVRRYLAILRIFNVKWAAKLDGILVNIEGRIIAPYLYVLRLFNGYGSWLNVILTAGAVIQRPVFINTMYAYQRDWINMWWAGQAAAPGVVFPPSTTPGAPAPALHQVQADFSAFVTGNTGPYAATAARAQAVLQANPPA